MPDGKPSHVSVVSLSLLAAGVLSVTFGTGYQLGRRAGALDPNRLAEARTLAQMQAQAKQFNNLTFYAQLTAPDLNDRTPLRQIQETPVAAMLHTPVAAKRVDVPVAEPTKVGTAAAKGPDPSRPTKPVDLLKTAHESFTLQISAFSAKQEAKAFAAALRRQGFIPYVVVAHLPQKGTWYRVRVGHYESRQEATAAKEKLLAKADIPAWIVHSD